MKVSKCKGMIDLLPADMVKFRYIERVFQDTCLKRGYGEVRTPTLEYHHLFTASGTLTPGMLGRVYSFLDWDGWSGERIVLRPDGTIPAARLYLENIQNGKTARLFYVENTFTFEETGKERRERWQCGAELIGSAQTLADVELILTAIEVLTMLGIESVTVRLSHAGLIRALLQQLGLKADQQTQVFNRLLEGDVKALLQMGGRDSNLDRAIALLLDVKGNSPAFLGNVAALLGGSLSAFEPSLKDMTVVCEMLSALGCPYEIDIASGSGFEYYTGVMFHFYSQTTRLGAGGRYDNLIPLIGGPLIPASGFALYLDRLMEIVDIISTRQQGVLLQPQCSDAGLVKLSLETARRMRAAGYIVELDVGQSEPFSYRWLLQVTTDKNAPFQLIDQSTGRKCNAKSDTAILEIMGGAT